MNKFVKKQNNVPTIGPINKKNPKTDSRRNVEIWVQRAKFQGKNEDTDAHLELVDQG